MIRFFRMDIDHFIEKASDLLDSIEIEFGSLQEKKRQLYPALSDAQFARLLGVTPATYSDYKTKKAATPSLKVGLKAAFALGLDLRNMVPDAAKIEDFFAENLR